MAKMGGVTTGETCQSRMTGRENEPQFMINYCVSCTSYVARIPVSEESDWKQGWRGRNW